MLCVEIHWSMSKSSILFLSSFALSQLVCLFSNTFIVRERLRANIGRTLVDGR